MVVLLKPWDYFNRDDSAWRLAQNFHVYEDAERARGSGDTGAWDAAGAAAAFDIRIARAKALDKARQKLIEAVHANANDAFGFALVQPDQVTRSIDGVDGAPDSAIML